MVIGKRLKYVCELCGQEFDDLIKATHCEVTCKVALMDDLDQIKTYTE